VSAGSARALAFIALALGLASGCRGAKPPAADTTAAGSASAAAPPATATPSAPGGRAAARSAAEDTARALIARHSLTRLRPECVTLERTAADSGVAFDVREKHGAACGGDPATAPRLFTLGLDTLTGAAWSDARSDDGTMRPLRPPAPPR
jgi:hypothetical protein